MSQRRGKKRTFAESEDVSVRSLWQHTRKKRKVSSTSTPLSLSNHLLLLLFPQKQRSKRRALPKELQQQMAKATAAYMTRKFDEVTFNLPPSCSPFNDHTHFPFKSKGKILGERGVDKEAVVPRGLEFIGKDPRRRGEAGGGTDRVHDVCHPPISCKDD